MSARTSSLTSSQAPACLPSLVAVLLAGLAACAEEAPRPRGGLMGGRVLVAPGAGLAGATVVLEQLALDGAEVAVRKVVGSAVTDAQGRFAAIATGPANGLMRLRTSGGAYRDPISGALVTLDAGAQLRALHWLDVSEDRGTSTSITPVHSLVEARFRQQLAALGDPTSAMAAAYQPFDHHLGELDWEQVVPAELDDAVTSPTAEVRAALVLGGLALLADDVRLASDASPQVVNLVTVLSTLQDDLADPLLDGNDRDDASWGSGLQLGPCTPPAAPCTPAPGACQDRCRSLCDVYSNTLRTLLAGEVAKFLGTREAPSAWNRTALGAQDARALLEHLGDNPEPALFGQACPETLDRLPPSIGWLAPAPERTFVRGDVDVSFSASDDSGVPPRAWFASGADEDGDLTNHVARTTLATATLADGPLAVTALAVDRAGNQRRATRVFEVDNTPPGLEVATTGYVPDARAWWTAAAAPRLDGTVTEPHLRRLTVRAGAGAEVEVATADGRWSVQLPAGAIARAGTPVQVRAEDLAGNATVRDLLLRLDDTAPAATALATTVKDERSDLIVFDGATPLHRHLGPAITLGGDGCPDVYLHAYLLDEGVPPYGGEIDGRNPLRWRFALGDDGVGIDPASAEFRVRAAAPGGAVLRDWTAVPTVPGGDAGPHVEVSLTRDGARGLPALGTVEAALAIDVRARDRLGREAVVTRCWTHHPLAAPVHVAAAVAPGVDAPAHSRALWAHGLESTRTQDLAALLLNPDAAGASVMDAAIRNGTAEPVYLRVSLAAPTTIQVTRAFSIAHDAVSAEETDEDCAAAPAACQRVPAPVHQADSFAAAPADLQVRLFSASASGAPVAELAPCAEPGCVNTATSRTYRLAPRTAAGAPRYVAMAWLGATPSLRPSSASWAATPPFAELTQSLHSYTGQQTEVSYCTRTADRGLPRVTYCTQRTTYLRRQSLDSATIQFSPMTLATFSAVTAASPARAAAPASGLPGASYDTAED